MNKLNKTTSRLHVSDIVEKQVYFYLRNNQSFCLAEIHFGTLISKDILNILHFIDYFKVINHKCDAWKITYYQNNCLTRVGWKQNRGKETNESQWQGINWIKKISYELKNFPQKFYRYSKLLLMYIFYTCTFFCAKITICLLH